MALRPEPPRNAQVPRPRAPFAWEWFGNELPRSSWIQPDQLDSAPYVTCPNGLRPSGWTAEAGFLKPCA